jgi:hypothetical protein
MDRVGVELDRMGLAGMSSLFFSFITHFRTLPAATSPHHTPTTPITTHTAHPALNEPPRPRRTERQRQPTKMVASSESGVLTGLQAQPFTIVGESWSISSLLIFIQADVGHLGEICDQDDPNDPFSMHFDHP